MDATNSGTYGPGARTEANSRIGEKILSRIELEAEIKALRTALDFEKRVESVLDLMDGSQGIRELFDFAVCEIPEALAFWAKLHLVGMRGYLSKNRACHIRTLRVDDLDDVFRSCVAAYFSKRPIDPDSDFARCVVIHGSGHFKFESGKAYVPVRISCHMSQSCSPVGFLEVPENGLDVPLDLIESQLRKVARAVRAHFERVQRHLLVEERHRRACEDQLTWLHNRLWFFERVGHFRRVSPHEGFSLVMIDIDHFKLVNDQHGHAVGDQLLKRVGAVLKEGLAEHGESVLWRMGWEEFLLYLHASDAERARAVAEELRNLLMDSHELEDATVKATASFWVASCLDPDEPVEEVVKKSDAAMYRSKREGRNRVSVFESGECCGWAAGKACCSKAWSERRFDWHSAISSLFAP